VTVGLAPAWDISCRGRDFDWGRHAEMDEQVVRPAGKALNVSYALAWMGLPSVAAGLWGRDDYEQMQRALSQFGGLVEVEMTTAEGTTRQNVTVVETRRHREMHLRCKSNLATERSLHRLNVDLSGLIQPGDTCVFAGAMPEDNSLDASLDLVWTCRLSGAQVAVDTHGPALKALVEAGLPWLIAPNVAELRDLLGSEVEDTPARLAEAGRSLLDRVEMALISRGGKGALLVTKDGAWTGCSRTQDEALSTVGCGDYLLAGFLAGLQETGDACAALGRGVKAATARAWGWTESKAWSQVNGEIAVAVESG
jgi:1-phosphofructokinase